LYQRIFKNVPSCSEIYFIENFSLSLIKKLL
jgi:hypothetical protein